MANPSTSPLNTDVLTIGFFNNAFPTVTNRQNSTNWQGRLIGRYSFKYDIGAAANFRVQSGYAYARVWTGTLPRAGTFRVFSENIENNRTDTAALLDFRADKAFRFGRYRFTAMADLFNAMNSNAITNFVLINGANYNKINATLDPRTFQVGLRFDFYRGRVGPVGLVGLVGLVGDRAGRLNAVRRFFNPSSIVAGGPDRSPSRSRRPGASRSSVQPPNWAGTTAQDTQSRLPTRADL